MVYYAPPLELDSNADAATAHYGVAVRAEVNGEVVHLLHELIPAADSTEYVPQVVPQCQRTAGESRRKSISKAGCRPMPWIGAPTKNRSPERASLRCTTAETKRQRNGYGKSD